MKHTPGPWKPLADPDWRKNTFYVATADTRCVQKTKRWQLAGGIIVCQLQNPADACLIAAAPDLLEVLQSLMEFWDNGTPVHPGAEVVMDARAVIAKATGGD